MIDRLRSAVFWRTAGILLVALALAMSLAACEPKEDATDTGKDATEVPVETTPLVLASTTSTQDSGLFDVLIPAFEEAYPQYKVEVIAVGTGEALELGQNKDADVLLVHAKAKEETFVADGYGTERRGVMYNDFIIVGPADDPAGIKGLSVIDALKKLASTKSVFVSRGDESGTHTAEKALWGKAAITPAGDWYMSAGQGMGDVLKIASETPGYTMTDRATYLNLKDSLALEILVEGDTSLFNQYGVIPVVGAANPDGARAFADWIVSDEGQAVIEAYGVEEFGAPLFFPNAE
jgi:tungstate transport system substrate-binding protein